jgi:chromosome segregation ATPase
MTIDKSHTDFISAIVEIARDPKAWDARVAELRKQGEAAAKAMEEVAAREQAVVGHRRAAEAALAEIRRKAADAEYLHKQVADKEKALAEREALLRVREAAVTDQDHRAREAINKASEAHNNLDQREKALAEREKAAAAKLEQAKTLLASYDEAKHRAALKLAS